MDGARGGLPCSHRPLSRCSPRVAISTSAVPHTPPATMTLHAHATRPLVHRGGVCDGGSPCYGCAGPQMQKPRPKSLIRSSKRAESGRSPCVGTSTVSDGVVMRDLISILSDCRHLCFSSTDRSCAVLAVPSAVDGISARNDDHRNPLSHNCGDGRGGDVRVRHGVV